MSPPPWLRLPQAMLTSRRRRGRSPAIASARSSMPPGKFTPRSHDRRPRQEQEADDQEGRQLEGHGPAVSSTSHQKKMTARGGKRRKSRAAGTSGRPSMSVAAGVTPGTDTSCSEGGCRVHSLDQRQLRRVERLDPDGRGLELGRAGLGSVASMVSRLTATSSWKCRVMNVSPGRSDESIRIGDLDLAAARHDADRSPSAARSSRRPRARCRGSRPAGAARCSRWSGRRCCTGRDAGRWSAGSGSRRQLVDRRIVVNRHERDAIAGDRVLPQPRVQVQLAGCVSS